MPKVEATIENIIKIMRSKNKNSDSSLILRAYQFADKHHEGQLRKSGENYMIHPLNVALILSTLELDDETICAAFLHDVVEDTLVTSEDITREFGQTIAEMVEGVTKLGKIQYTNAQEEQIENYRKMFLAMAKDIRVVLIKLADRLHNMRTLEHLEKDRQIFNSKETLDLYAPLANRLGIYSIKWELEDLAFRYLYPDEYNELVREIAVKREERLKFIDSVVDDIQSQLKREKIEAEITGRAKHLYSIYKKMR